jgi:hypothetical protein
MLIAEDVKSYRMFSGRGKILLVLPEFRTAFAVLFFILSKIVSIVTMGRLYLTEKMY